MLAPAVRLFGLLALGTLAAPTTSADQVVLLPSKDNTLIEDDPNLSDGAGPNFFIGAIASGGARRALVKFDLSSIPPGSEVSSATLRFVINRAAIGSGLDDTAALHRVTADWGEGDSNTARGSGAQATALDATWLHRFYGGGSVPRVFWSSAGGDYVVAATGVTTIGGIGAYQFPSSSLLVADVEFWVDNPLQNFGWIVLGPESDSQTARRIHSRESTSPPDRPMLTVNFTPPAADSDADVPLPAWALAVLGAMLMGFVARFKQGRSGT